MAEETNATPYVIKESILYDGIPTQVVEMKDSKYDEIIAATSKGDHEMAFLYKQKTDGRYYVIIVPNKPGINASRIVCQICEANPSYTPAKYENTTEQARIIADNLSFIPSK